MLAMIGDVQVFGTPEEIMALLNMIYPPKQMTRASATLKYAPIDADRWQTDKAPRLQATLTWV